MTETTEKKIKVGWFSFSCCEDSTVIFTEILNDHWQEWKKILDIRHARVLQAHNIMDEFDVAFVEGAIASEEHENKVREIREKAKYLVAIGSCACIGMPSAQRNNFNAAQLQEIQFLVDRFRMNPKVMKLADVVKVDYEVPGCPMSPDDFLKKLGIIVGELQKASA